MPLQTALQDTENILRSWGIQLRFRTETGKMPRSIEMDMQKKVYLELGTHFNKVTE